MNDGIEEDDEGSLNEPSIEGLLKHALDDAGEGWPGLNPEHIGRRLKKSRALQDAAFRKEGQLFKRVFLDNPEGRQVLEILLDQTLRRAAWPVFQMQSAEMLQAVGIWREAENSFVQAILATIARAKGESVQQRRET